MNQKELLRLCDEIDALLARDPCTLTARECSHIYTTLRNAAGTLSAAARQSVRLVAACQKLVDYRKRNTLNFQLEKADDFIKAIAKEIGT